MSFATADLLDVDESLAVCELQFRRFGTVARFCGPLRTVRCHHDNALVRRVLSQPGEGRVLVIDGGGSLHSALVGDVLAATAVEHGWAGIIVHGAIRDGVAIDRLQLGIKALGTNPRRSAKAGLGEIDVVVRFGGVEFVPGHHLYSDEDGIVLSPVAL